MFVIQLDLNYSFLLPLDLVLTQEKPGEKNLRRYLPDPRTEAHTETCTHVHTDKDKLDKLLFLPYT